MLLHNVLGSESQSVSLMVMPVERTHETVEAQARPHGAALRLVERTAPSLTTAYQLIFSLSADGVPQCASIALLTSCCAVEKWSWSPVARGRLIRSLLPFRMTMPISLGFSGTTIFVGSTYAPLPTTYPMPVVERQASDSDRKPEYF